MPSLFEGLSMASVEAQQALLPCIVSNAIPDEAIQTKYVKRIELDLKLWIKEIQKIDINKRKENDNQNLKNNYDIKKVAKKLEERYLSFIK